MIHQGKLDFCQSCRLMIDTLIDAHNPEEHLEGLYIEINPEAETPPRHIKIPLCDNCKVMASEIAGRIDGFIVVFP